MGTRADFYVGYGPEAEWLGSIAWDGYPDGIDAAVLSAQTPDAFRAAVASMCADRDDFTAPDQGWPWPWENSATTDFAYMLDGEKVRTFCFGTEQLGQGEDGETIEGGAGSFPEFSTENFAGAGSKRSGTMLLRG